MSMIGGRGDSDNSQLQPSAVKDSDRNGPGLSPKTLDVSGF